MGASQSTEEPQSRRLVLENEDGNCKVRSINVPTDSLDKKEGSVSLSEDILISLLEEDGALVEEDEDEDEEEWQDVEEIEDQLSALQGLEAAMLPQFTGPLTHNVLPLPDMLKVPLTDIGPEPSKNEVGELPILDLEDSIIEEAKPIKNIEEESPTLKVEPFIEFKEDIGPEPSKNEVAELAILDLEDSPIEDIEPIKKIKEVAPTLKVEPIVEFIQDIGPEPSKNEVAEQPSLDLEDSPIEEAKPIKIIEEVSPTLKVEPFIELKEEPQEFEETEPIVDKHLVMGEQVGHELLIIKEPVIPTLISEPEGAPEAEVVQEAAVAEASIIVEPIIQEVKPMPVEEVVLDITTLTSRPPVLEQTQEPEPTELEPVVSESVISETLVSESVVSKPLVTQSVAAIVPESSLFQKVFDFIKPVEAVVEVEEPIAEVEEAVVEEAKFVVEEAPRQTEVSEQVVPPVVPSQTTTKLADSLFGHYKQQEVEKVILNAKLEGAKDQAKLDADVMSGILSNERARWRNKFNVVEQSLQKRKVDISTAHESAIAMVTSQLNILEEKPAPCGSNVSDIIDCYINNPGESLLCKEFTDSFEHCVSQALTSR